MTEVVFVVEVPAPQLTPTLDAMARRGIDLSAFYHVAQDTAHGWGRVVPVHPHCTVPSGTIRSCLFLARRVFDRDLRVLCCFGYNHLANIVMVLLARLRGVQVVTRSDSSWLIERQRPWIRTRAKQLILLLVYGRRARVWTIGSNNDRYWAEVGLMNRRLIPFGLPCTPIGTAEQGLDFRMQRGIGAGLVFLYVGVLEVWKGPDILLESFCALPNPDVHLVVVGRGHFAGAVERAAASDRRVVFTGSLPQDSLGAAYVAADVLVLPSRYEPWGLVVDEAQANGLRVIASDAVGCGIDRLRHSNGWLFPTGSVEALTATLAAAAEEYRCGWRPLPKRTPYDCGPEMIADLVQLGMTVPMPIVAGRRIVRPKRKERRS